MTKPRIALITASIIVVIIGVVWVIQHKTDPLNVEIQLSSNPYPMTVGQSTLVVILTDSDHKPVSDAAVQIHSLIDHPGSLPILVNAPETKQGEYSAPVIWPMAGQWVIDVTVELQEQQGFLQEQFEVFVYALTPADITARTTYTSVSETNAAMSADSSRELWIFIPQGTEAMMNTALGHDLLPLEIRLQVSGKNTLVIRNDDLVDHVIGPFFIRAGETVRQVFNQPAVFQGTCSIGISTDISIIVEE